MSTLPVGKTTIQLQVSHDLKEAVVAAATLHDKTLTAWMIDAIWDNLPAAVAAALELQRLDEIRRDHVANKHE